LCFLLYLIVANTTSRSEHRDRGSYMATMATYPFDKFQATFSGPSPNGPISLELGVSASADENITTRV
jgi:hypothetical protein